MPITIFCPNCQTYLGSTTLSCPACGRERLPVERLPKPGCPQWRATLDDAALVKPLVADARVYFAWSERWSSGGVTAFDRLTGEPLWRRPTPSAVVAGFAASHDRLYFSVLDLLRSSTQVYCLQQSDGVILWQQSLNGSVWSAPILSEARLLIGTDNGQIHCFDNRDGQPLSRQQLFRLPRGRIWLSGMEGRILALSQSGQVLALDTLTLRPLWHTPLDIGCQITSAPAAGGGRLYFGGEGGKVLALDPRQRSVQTLATGMKRVVAAPAFEEGVLYIGAHDHFLHALDAQTSREIWRSREFEHSISSAPFAADGLVIVCVNQMGVYLLDAHTGEEVWRFPVEHDVRLLSDPLLQDGLIYAGTDKGQVYALPWHLGRYAWAAGRMELESHWGEAGNFHALAGENAFPGERSAHFSQAVACWLKSDQPEWAARFREVDVNSTSREIAETFEAAGQALYTRDQARAAHLLRTAAEWYQDANEEEAARRCWRTASRVARGPHLRIEEVNVPRQWEEEEEQQVVIELTNRGNAPAENIRLRLAGNLAARIWLELEAMRPQQKVEIAVPLLARSSGELVADVRYRDACGADWSASKRFPITVREPSAGKVIVEGDVGALLLKELPHKVVVRGDVGLLKVSGEKV